MIAQLGMEWNAIKRQLFSVIFPAICISCHRKHGAQHILLVLRSELGKDDDTVIGYSLIDLFDAFK